MWCNDMHPVFFRYCEDYTVAWEDRMTKGQSGNRYGYAGIVVCMRPVNGRRRYNVTSSFIDRAHTKTIHDMGKSTSSSTKIQ